MLLLSGLPQELVPDFYPDEWISPELDKLPPHIKRALVSNHQALMLRYKAMRITLAQTKVKKTRNQLIEQHKAAIYLAEILEQIYSEYWYNPYALDGIRKQHEGYRKNLLLLNNKLKIAPLRAPAIAISPMRSVIQNILEYHPIVTTARLFIARCQRLMINVSNVVGVSAQFVSGIKQIVRPFILPIFTHLAWISFIPRILACVVLAGIRVFDGEHFSWFFRLINQLKDNWAELANDIPWLISGLAGAFFLTGSLAIVGVYLTVALFYWDIITAGIRSFMNLIDLYALREQYTAFGDIQIDDMESVEQYLKAIDEQIVYQKKQMALTLTKVTLMFLTMCLTIPFIVSFSVMWVPVAAAAIMCLITALCFVLAKVLDAHAPAMDVPVVNPHSFFQPEEDLDCMEESLSLTYAT